MSEEFNDSVLPVWFTAPEPHEKYEINEFRKLVLEGVFRPEGHGGEGHRFGQAILGQDFYASDFEYNWESPSPDWATHVYWFDKKE